MHSPLSFIGLDPKVIKMAAKSNKTLLIAVVVIVVIIIVCAAAYVLLKNNNNDNNNSSETEYSFYIYYGSDNPDNAWISADSSTALDALYSALDNEGVAYDIDNTGWVTSINNVEPDYFVDNESWYTWTWSADSDSWVIAPDVIGNLTDSTYFIGVTGLSEDADGYMSIATLDPNTVSGWQGEGPFA